MTPGLNVCFVFTPQSVSSYSQAVPTLRIRITRLRAHGASDQPPFSRARPRPRPRWFL